MGMAATPEAGPTFRVAFLFHADIALLRSTLPRCVEALTSGTTESFEVVLHCDGSPPETVAEVSSCLEEWGVDELVVRQRSRHVASGDPSNNGHRRLVDSCRARYLVVVEDDVVMYRTQSMFDVLSACRGLFERHPSIPVLSKVDDHAQWSWKLRDRGPGIEVGVRSVNRLSTHFVVYDTHRFVPAARRFGAFDLDVFIDREDHSYNWEDVVSHVATSGGRHIAFPQSWPLDVFHCDRKVAPGSMYHTQDPATKASVLAELERRYRPVSVDA